LAVSGFETQSFSNRGVCLSHAKYASSTANAVANATRLNDLNRHQSSFGAQGP
jgi:hypothetical protein